MKTLYSACLSRLGLTQSEAAALHEVRIDTVKSWCAGRNRVPPGAWIDLREHEAQIVELSEELREKWALAPAELHIHLRGRTANLMAVADFVLNAEDAHHSPMKKPGSLWGSGREGSCGCCHLAPWSAALPDDQSGISHEL